MANAEVYCKWSNQGDGSRGHGGWGFVAQATAQGNAGIVALSQHAERRAWATAWHSVRQRVDREITRFAGHKLQIKIWVDQQICPSCQKWMLIDVIAQLKQLHVKHPKLVVELYAEVLFASVTHRIRVQRTTIWPVAVGFHARYEDLPEKYN